MVCLFDSPGKRFAVRQQGLEGGNNREDGYRGMLTSLLRTSITYVGY
jgi:hypothetical protein